MLTVLFVVKYLYFNRTEVITVAEHLYRNSHRPPVRIQVIRQVLRSMHSYPRAILPHTIEHQKGVRFAPELHIVYFSCEELQEHLIMTLGYLL